MSAYRCPSCFDTLSTMKNFLKCQSCGEKYFFFEDEFPKIYKDESLGLRERALKERLYDSILGKAYSFFMPLLLLPVRPFKQTEVQWFVYIFSLLLLSMGYLR